MMIMHWHLKLEKKERKKEPCQICGGDYQKKIRNNEKGSGSSNAKTSSVSINTVKKDKSWSEKEFVRKLEDQLNIEELTTEEIFSIVKPTTT